MTTALTSANSVPDLWNPETFGHALKLANLFKDSALIPKHLQGKLPDVAIALLMAKRLNEDPLIVMQNIYIVSGKAGWSAQYIIARANRSGIFRGRINWRETGADQNLEITAYATLADTGEEIAMTASMKMARDEGWTSNAKYKSMPQVMLRYRSATLLVRLYAPEVMLGIQTVEEIEDVEAATPARVVLQPLGPAPSIESAGGTRAGQLSAILDAVEEPTPAVAAPPPAVAATAAKAPAAEVAVDPERAGLLTIVHGLEADLPGPSTRAVRKSLDIGAKVQAGDLPTEKLDAYRKALQGEADEIALTGGDQ